MRHHPSAYRLFPVLLALVACGPGGPTVKQTESSPAAQYCIQSGGQLYVNKTGQGNQIFCHTKAGPTVDAWEYFNRAHG